tara:strand:+ start:5037 stop:6131 length:1095 start_codon:yes stop_codon:yes gene_type:complete
MSDNKELFNKYKEFIEIINENIEKNIEIDESTICEKTKNYYQSIYDNKKFKKYLLERREKLFYANNVQLFDDINIRKVLEKVDNENKLKIWNYLQLFYIINDNKNDNFTLKLIENIENNLKSDTNPLIDDLVENIQNLLNDIDINDNPLQKIISISKTLADKYRDDIQAGKISLDDIMKYINKSMNNDNFGENIFNNLDLSEENISKVFNNLLNNEQLKSLINLDGNLDSKLDTNIIGNLFSNLLENNIKDEKLDEKKLKQMEEYFNNVSTDNLDSNILNIDNEDDENDNKSLNNLSEMLFSQINNIKNNIDTKLSEENNEEVDPINMEELDKLKNSLMNELTDEQQTEIKNLTENLLSGFGLK